MTRLLLNFALWLRGWRYVGAERIESNVVIARFEKISS